MLVAMSGFATLHAHVPVGENTCSVCRAAFGKSPPPVLTDSGSRAIPKMLGSVPAACSRTRNANGACKGQHECVV